MFDGFIPGSRATLMLDIASIGMAVIVPLMGWSIWLVRYKKKYRLHARIQLLIALILLLVVVLFELDMRVYGWQKLAEKSPHFDTWLFPVLYVHLVFAISTSLLWVYTVVAALRRFGLDPKPNKYSRTHRIVARMTAIDTVMTTLTGWFFYYLAFVAS